MPSERSNRIIAAIRAAIAAAPERERDELGEALEDYVAHYPRSWASATNGGTIGSRALIAAELAAFGGSRLMLED